MLLHQSAVVLTGKAIVTSLKQGTGIASPPSLVLRVKLQEPLKALEGSQSGVGCIAGTHEHSSVQQIELCIAGLIAIVLQGSLGSLVEPVLHKEGHGLAKPRLELRLPECRMGEEHITGVGSVAKGIDKLAAHRKDLIETVHALQVGASQESR